MNQKQAANCLTLASLLDEVPDSEWDFRTSNPYSASGCCAIGHARRRPELFEGFSHDAFSTDLARDLFGRDVCDLLMGRHKKTVLSTRYHIYPTRADIRRFVLAEVDAAGWEEA